MHTATRVWIVERRYSEFDTFRETLQKLFPQSYIPILPPKKKNLFSRTKSFDELEERRKGLELFLNKILESTIYADLKLTDIWKQFIHIPIKDNVTFIAIVLILEYNRYWKICGCG